MDSASYPPVTSFYDSVERRLQFLGYQFVVRDEESMQRGVRQTRGEARVCQRVKAVAVSEGRVLYLSVHACSIIQSL